VVARCRKIFGQKKVGHAGTLDPDATGILLVGLGRATRLLRFLTGLPKSYSGEVVLGVATSTLDESGDVTGHWDMAAVTLDQARTAALELTGAIEQVPPMVSAIQVGGRRLHELARQGIEIEREPRQVTVHRLVVSPPADPDPGPHGGGPVFAIEVDCSSGTYIRSLAADLGRALGGDAYLRHLRRLAVGPFALDEAIPLDQVGPEHVVPLAGVLRDLPSVTVDRSLATAVGFGQVLARSALGLDGPGPWALIGPDGDLLAVYEAHSGERIKPAVVLAPATPGDQ
jgi:tRNA pseudouridine55 synthase